LWGAATMGDPNYIKEQLLAGLCANGDKRPRHPGSARHCGPCLLYMRQYQRIKKGWQPRQPGTFGKQPMAGPEETTWDTPLWSDAV